jgi:hypothetical protein
VEALERQVMQLSHSVELNHKDTLHKLDSLRQDEQHSREENDAEHKVLGEGITREHNRINILRTDFETHAKVVTKEIGALAGKDDTNTVEKVKELKKFLLKALGTIILMAVTALGTYVLTRVGLR